jgi:spermidine/putrescine-binding protein
MALVVVVAACGGGDVRIAEPPPAPVCAPGQIDGDLTVFSWPDYIPQEVLDGFRRRYGVEISMLAYESNEVLLAQLQVRADRYDVAFPSEYMVDILWRDGLLLEVDRDAFTNMGNLDSAFLNPPYDPDGSHSVPYHWGTVGLGINRNVVGEVEIPSWSLVFDPEQSDHWAGRISLLDDPRQALGAALKYLGHSANTTDEIQLAAAENVIADALANIGRFEDENYGQLLVDGEIDVAQGRSDVFFSAFNAGNAWNDYAYIVPLEGTIAWVQNMVVPVTSQSPCSAHTFIDFLMEPENAAAGTNHTKYATPNQAAAQYVDAAILSDPSIYPPAAARAGIEFLANTGDFEIRYLEAFSRLKE